MVTIGTTCGKSYYDRLCRCAGTLGVDESSYRICHSRLIVCDMLNADTFAFFGFIRDVEMLRLRPVPFFDSGDCLRHAKTASRVTGRDRCLAVRPFGPVPERQLALVEDAT